MNDALTLPMTLACGDFLSRDAAEMIGLVVTAIVRITVLFAAVGGLVLLRSVLRTRRAQRESACPVDGSTRRSSVSASSV